MQIAAHFKTVEACKNIPLLQTLKMATKHQQPPVSDKQPPPADKQPLHLHPKQERLWALVGEVTTETFEIADADHRAFAAFVAAVGDEDRAIRVALCHIWDMIQVP
jgi:hypothetical protein